MQKPRIILDHILLCLICFRQEAEYEVIYVDVESPNGEMSNCRTYQMPGRHFEIPTSPQYLEVIRTGASIAGLPDYYQKFLSEVEHNGYSGPLQVTAQLGKKFKEEQRRVQKR